MAQSIRITDEEQYSKLKDVANLADDSIAKLAIFVFDRVLDKKSSEEILGDYLKWKKEKATERVALSAGQSPVKVRLQV